MEQDYIEGLVSNLIKKYDTSDPFILCKKLDIHIAYNDLGKKVLGYSTTIKRIPWIVLNTRSTEKENNYVCAHELGHNRMHKGVNASFFEKNASSTFMSKREYEANQFMIQLLLNGIEIEESSTKGQILRQIGLPYEFERFI